MKILAIGAHPDDIEIGCGGTILKHLENGDEVEFLVMTGGEAGSIEISKDELAKTRQSEAISGAKVLGVDKVHFFGLEDGLTSFTRSQKVTLIGKIREIKPDIIYVHSSSDNSFDHQIIHQMVLAAAFSASGPWFGEAGKHPPHEVKNIYGFEVWSPLSRFQKIVAFDEETMNSKIEALRCHKTQTDGFNYVEAVKGLGSYRGAMSGRAQFAEVFEIVKIED